MISYWQIELGKIGVAPSALTHLNKEIGKIWLLFSTRNSSRIAGVMALGLIFSLFIQEMSAQNDSISISCADLPRRDRVELANSWIDQLHDHGLIVVLESNRNKITFLEKTLQNPGDLSPQQKRSHRKDLEKLKEKTEYKGLQMISGFSENYSFSQVHFLWDHDIPHLISQPDAPLLLDDSLQYIQNSKFENPDELFFLIRGRVDPANGSGIEAFLVRNTHFNPLCRPFPFYVARNENFFVNVLLSIFNPDLYGERSSSKVAEDLDSNFNKFRGG